MFCQQQLKSHGWAQIETQEINGHWIITHWTHMEDIWNGLEASYSVTYLQIASALPKNYSNSKVPNIFTNGTPKSGMAGHT
jgi:hypothetical protein